MASIDPVVARIKARRAYELGRLRLALRSALLVVPMVGLSLVACREPALSLAAGTALFVLALGVGWRGQTYGRAVLPGLIAGTVPLVLPLMLRSSGHCCIGGGCWSVCMIGCIGGGLFAGATIGLLSSMEREHRWSFLAAATLLAGLAGVLGCAIIGLAGIVGMAQAVIASSVPVALAARLRASS